MTSPSLRVALPAVTVIIPAFGVNAYIREAIDSVLAQRYPDYEVVVVNDGAPAEETAELKAILAGYGGRVRYLERENGGQGAARNTAMRVSRSEFVAFLDGDDCWMPDFLERQMELFEQDRELALAYCDLRIFGNTIAAGSTYMRSDPSTGDVTLESLLAGRCSVAMSTIVARRQAIIDAGWFDERLRYCEDFDLWFRMAHRGMPMAYLREALAFRRVRSDSLSQNVITLNTVAIEVLERFEREHELVPAERRAWKTAVARLQCENALAEAKLRLHESDYHGALTQLEMLRPEFVNWKVQCAKAGLRVLPATVRLSYEVLERLHGLRRRRHVERLELEADRALEPGRVCSARETRPEENRTDLLGTQPTDMV